MQTTIEATGTAPAGAVWERYMDPTVWSSWAPQIDGVEYSEQRLTADTTGRVHGPMWLRVDFEIVDVDEAAWTWTWNAWFQFRPLGLTLAHGVASRPNGCRTWVTVTGSRPLIIPYVPVAKLALMRLVRP